MLEADIASCNLRVEILTTIKYGESHGLIGNWIRDTYMDISKEKRQNQEKKFWKKEEPKAKMINDPGSHNV